VNESKSLERILRFNGEAAAPLWGAGDPRVERLFSFNGPNVWLQPGAGRRRAARHAPLVAHCHLGPGRLYHRAGKREQAQEHFTCATMMYRELGMRFWLEQTESEN
jgi:hypothetical protein